MYTLSQDGYILSTSERKDWNMEGKMPLMFTCDVHVMSSLKQQQQQQQQQQNP